MSDRIHVSAPGKLMLLGEHAVVHGRTCLVTAVDARLHLTLAVRPGDATPVFTIHAPDVGVDQVSAPIAAALAGGQAQARGTRFIESALAVWRDHFGLPHSVQITTRSDFASTLGLGSSSATVACTLYALAHALGPALDLRALFELGLEAIFRVQQTGSGFDLAAALYGGTLFYHNRAPRTITPLNVPDLPLLAAYSGIKADTPQVVGRVTALLQAHPTLTGLIFDAMHQAVLEGQQALAAHDWARLGVLFDIQHGLAHALGVDTPELAALVFAARGAGAYGAKLSGAGGGDCLIALVPSDRRAEVRAALEGAGGTIVPAAPHAPGVRVEPQED